MTGKRLLQIALMFWTVLASSCHTIHSFTKDKEYKEEAIRQTIRKSQIRASSLKETYTARLFYDNSRQTVSGMIDIPSDTLARITINSSFGLPVARLSLTHDSAFVSSIFMENINKRNDQLLPVKGLNLSTRTLKDLLLANFIIFSDTVDLDNYSINIQNDTFVILNYRTKNRLRPQLSDFSNTLVYSLLENKVLSNSFWFAQSDTQIIIKYSSFKPVDKYFIPTKISLFLIQSVDTILNAKIKVKKIHLK